MGEVHLLALSTYMLSTCTQHVPVLFSEVYLNNKKFYSSATFYCLFNILILREDAIVIGIFVELILVVGQLVGAAGIIGVKESVIWSRI